MSSDHSLSFFWLAAAVVAGWLVHLLAPYLSPFVTAAILGYIGAPLVGRLERRRVPRTAGAALVLLLMLALTAAMVAVVAPLVAAQVGQLVETLPAIGRRLGQALVAVAPQLSEAVETQDWSAVLPELAQDGELVSMGMLKSLAASLGSGIGTLFAVAANVALVPLVLFYVLRDWDRIIARCDELLPRARAGRVREILGECDRILGEFLRAQLAVILIMVALYSALLWPTGVNFAFAIGAIAGVFVFVPYFGFLLGLALGLLVAWAQGGGAAMVGAVALAMTVGTLVESFAVTPLIVGKRTGLHPVTILLLLAAGGGLFGFVGMLLALPAGAVGTVLLRHARERYMASRAYRP